MPLDRHEQEEKRVQQDVDKHDRLRRNSEQGDDYVLPVGKDVDSTIRHWSRRASTPKNDKK